MPDESKRRPCVVLSADWLNQYALDVMVVPVTSVTRGNFPTRVELSAGEGGLRVDSWAKCDQVTTMSKRRLTGEHLGHLSQAKMQEIAGCETTILQAEAFLNVLRRLGSLPTEVAVRSERAYELLEPVAEGLGIRLTRQRSLPALEQARATLEQWMMR